jgi:hypothetical protein
MLSGWGAGLDLKRVDYLTIDDRDLEGASADETPKPTSPDDTRSDGEETSGSSHDGESVFDIEDRQGKSELVQLKPAQIDGERSHLGTWSHKRQLTTKSWQTSVSKLLS